jgi:hypothetical protein
VVGERTTTETITVEAMESPEMLEFKIELVSEKPALETPNDYLYCSCACV